jgi:asparagine synthase (glutamine-hydrolysing)
MEAAFSAWALGLSKAACIGERPIELCPAGERLVHQTGKLPLRGAFPRALSAWRRKDPIEVGSGSDKLGKGWFESEEAIRVHGIFPAPLGTPLGDAIAAARVVPRDAECQANFGAFLAAYPAVGRGVDLPANGPTPARRLGHVGSCIECGYALSRPTAMFCRVCGAWPARHVAPPPAAAAAVAAAVEP